MAEVIFNKLEKVYSNGFKAVHGIDLKIADGEFMVIVGPSGCAKSTTLRMLAGLETISGGEVRIGDKIVNNLAPKSRGIAFVAGFIGAPEMNIRPSQLVEHGGRLHLTLGDQRLPLNDRLQSKVETHKNQQVFFGVRPEFVSLSDEPFAESSCAGEMVRVENMGHEFFVYLRVADYELTARVPSDDAKPMIAKGLNRKVYFTFDLNKCHIFDAKTEQNLSL